MSKIVTASLRKIFVLVVIVLLQLGGASPITMAAPGVVRVGYDVTGVLLIKDQEGVYRGYNADFLYEIAKYTNWKYEFVPFNTWAGALQALEQGKIDVLPTVMKSPAREKTMLFANHWMGMMHVALVVPYDDKVHFYGDLASLQGMRIGVRKNTKDAEDVKTWAKHANLQYELSVYGDNKELLEALDAGKIDAAGLSYVGRARKYRAITEFANQEMYFAIAPARTDLKVQMDAAMGQIASLNPEFYSNIMNKLTGRETNPVPVFSLREQELIDQGKPVRVTFLRNSRPFSYVDEDGAYKGLLPEILRRISDLSKLKFTYVPVDTDAQAIQAVQKGEADMIGRMLDNLVYAQKHQLRLTSTYMDLPLVQISARDAGEIKKVGLQDEAQLDMIKFLSARNKKIQYQLYSNVNACFQALRDKEIDAIYCDTTTASYFMETMRMADYQMAVSKPLSYSFTFGMGPEADSRVAIIIDKCIRCISSRDLETLLLQDHLQEHFSLVKTIERLPGKYLFGMGAIMLAVILLLGYQSLSLWRKRDVEKRMQTVRENNRRMATDLEMAQKVNEAREELFLNLERDMRQPAGEVVQYLQQARDEENPEAKEVFIKQALAAGNKMQEDLDDVLLFAQLEYGEPQLNMASVNSRELIEKIVAPFKAQAQKQGLTFVFDNSGLEARQLMADAHYLQLAFTKVFDNALKFTPAGGTINLTVESLPSAQGRFALWATFKDSGVGIGKEFLPHIYEPFAKEEKVEAAGLAGKGLGLSIVRRIQDLLGGEVEIKSSLHEGTTVQLEYYFDVASV